MDQLMVGAITMGFCVAAVFFLRFWRDTRDRLFALFALAFFVMAANRVGIALSERADSRAVESQEEQYWVRFLAFAIILVAILDKNRPRPRPTREPDRSRENQPRPNTPENEG